jgi:ribulose-phosphate 3-epimerase
MSVIAPAILCGTPEDYKAQIERIHGFAERVHIDICDGEFTPNYTISPAQVWWPQEWMVDIHMMVARPSEYLETIISLKPNMVIFHVEVQQDILPVMKHVKKFGIKVGVALLRPTVPASVRAAIEEADHVMIFSGTLGSYGGTASLMQIEKIRIIRSLKPGIEIGWDGGITPENAFTIAQGGVDVLNVGGSIASSPDPRSVYAKLVSEINKHGVL